MISRFKRFFLHSYDGSSYTRRRLASSLLYFAFATWILLTLLIIISLILDLGTKQTVVPTAVVILFFFTLSLFILRSGRYHFAANLTVSVIVLSLTAGAYYRAFYAPHIAFSSTFYFLVGTIVLATLFNRRGWVIGYSVFIAVNDVIIYFIVKDRLDPLGLEAARIGVMYILFPVIFITIVGLLITWIFRGAVAQVREESGKNREQFLVIQKLLASTAENSARLAGLASSLSDTSSTFSRTTQGQAAAIEQITSAFEEVSSSMEFIGRGSDEQSGVVVDLVARMDELSGIIRDVGEITTRTLEITNRTAEEAKAGEQFLQKMNQSLSGIVESSKDITNIIGIINDISDRINLLSLNAAIEAARAGEAGRGFAVVADEVSKLADQTATSIKDIDRFIQSNNQEISSGMSDIIGIIEKIARVIESIGTMTDMMHEIFKSIRMQMDVNRDVNVRTGLVKSKSEEIRTAITEQKNAFFEIMKSITEINELNQHTVAESEKIALGSNEISTMAEQLDEVMRNAG